MSEEKIDKVIIIAEIGINHNGDVDLAKRIIDIAVRSKCSFVKFQKRTVEDVYSKKILDSPRDSKWGKTTRDQKNGLELSQEEYDEIYRYCQEKNIDLMFSCWDLKSVEFIKQYNCKMNKIASPLLTAIPLLESIAKQGKTTLISTGMSKMDEIHRAVEIFKLYKCPFILMHCNSSYPMENKDANLNMIKILRDIFNCQIGWSGHERGLQISLAAVALGCSVIERHITESRDLSGSDQSASLEERGITQLVRDCNIIFESMGDGVKRITKKEQESRDKLANPYWYQQILENEK